MHCRIWTAITDFVIGLVNAAKDWQDLLQSTLPGYRERIATVYLKPEEGGINLTMNPSRSTGSASWANVVLRLWSSADPADQSPFDFDDHRWRRYLIAFARLEEALENASRTWNGNARFDEFIRSYQPKSYHDASAQWTTWRGQVFARLTT